LSEGIVRKRISIGNPVKEDGLVKEMIRRIRKDFELGKDVVLMDIKCKKLTKMIGPINTRKIYG
jgi:hypothetical protein